MEYLPLWFSCWLISTVITRHFYVTTMQDSMNDACNSEVVNLDLKINCLVEFNICNY